MHINYPDALTDHLRIFFLKVLVRLIAKNNSNQECVNIPIDEWEPDQWSDSRDSIKRYQDMLDDCGAASFIFQMFKQKNLIEK